MDTKSNHIGKKFIHGFGNTEGKHKKTSLFTPLYGTPKTMEKLMSRNFVCNFRSFGRDDSGHLVL